MIVETPDFINSPYIDVDVDGWYIKDDAPEELKTKFNEWIKLVNSGNNVIEE